MESPLNAIIEFIAQYFDCPQIGPEDDLIVGIPLDSIRVLELVLFLEKKFKIKIPKTFLSIEKMKTPKLIAEMVRQLATEP